MLSRLHGALCGMLLGDALAAPTHFYPNRESIESDLGVANGGGFRRPCAHHPCAVLESSRYAGDIDILHSARRFYDKPRRQDGKYSHPHRGLAAGENTLHGQLIQLLLQAMLQAEDFVPHFLSSMRDFLVAEDRDGEPAMHNDVYTYPWLRSYFERLSAAEASARVGPRRSAAAAIERQKRRQCGRSSALPDVPGSLLPLLIPIILRGVARSGKNTGCAESGLSGGRASHEFGQTVHSCVELVLGLICSPSGESHDLFTGIPADTGRGTIASVRDTVSMWSETLWDVLCPLVNTTHAPATVFARMVPVPAEGQSRRSLHADPDPCEELLLQLRAAAEYLTDEVGGMQSTSSVWTSNLQVSCMLGGDSITRCTVLGGVLGAAVGFDGLPVALVDSLRNSETHLGVIYSFVSAVTEGDRVQSQARTGPRGLPPEQTHVHETMTVDPNRASADISAPADRGTLFTTLTSSSSDSDSASNEGVVSSSQLTTVGLGGEATSTARDNDGVAGVAGAGTFVCDRVQSTSLSVGSVVSATAVAPDGSDSVSSEGVTPCSLLTPENLSGEGMAAAEACVVQSQRETKHDVASEHAGEHGCNAAGVNDANANVDARSAGNHNGLAEINTHRGVATRGPVGLGTWTDTRLLADPEPSPTGCVDIDDADGAQATELLSCSSIATSPVDWCSAIGSPRSIAGSVNSSSSQLGRSSSRASTMSHGESVAWSSDSFGSAIEFGPAGDGAPSG
jgi:hypothetical protein